MSTTNTSDARIVFMGTPDFAVPSLEASTKLGKVVLVVTQPDRPKGRGQTYAPPPVKKWALEHGLNVVQPEKLKVTRFHEQLKPLKPDVIVVAAYGKILPPEILAVPSKGCVNVHASLLPKYRGAAPIQWAIANGEKKTGISLMVLEEGLDTGPIFVSHEICIQADDTASSMHDKLSWLGAQLLLNTLPKYLSGQLVPQPQDHSQATYAPLLKKEDGRVDFSLPAAQIESRMRGFSPWPGAFCVLEGKTLKLLKAEVSNGTGKPGEILSANQHGIEIACGRDSLRILELQPEGKKPMTISQYLAGHRLP
jgi:methionyl-tRNA formyltransferase